jgi:hypothetical protein
MQCRNPLPLFTGVERRSLEIILFPSFFLFILTLPFQHYRQWCAAQISGNYFAAQFFLYIFLPCPFNTIVNGVERRSRESIQASARRATHAMQPVLIKY